MSALAERPIAILIAALGGEGGGVLAEWLIDAADAEGFPAQSTSIPGVSQRTGATTYYVEIFPTRRELLGGREPVMALTPSPGNVDLMAASELIEVGRAMQNGYVSPDRTTLIGSTHRVYATHEKIQLGDGRFDSRVVLEAAGGMARRAVLTDMSDLAQKAGSIINTVLFGAMAGSGALPLSRAACEQAIRQAGKGVEASLRGFAAGFDAASSESGAAEPARPAAWASPDLPNAIERHIARFPIDVQELLALGAAQLIDYQDTRYADLYLTRVETVLGTEQDAGAAPAGFALTREVARQLAVWMSYEDVIRVADLKTRRSRFERVRREVGARQDQPLAIVDYFKPGPAEMADVLPPAWAERVRNRAAGKPRPVTGGVELKTSTIAGFLALRAVSLLRGWRRHTARFREEQALIERWLADVRRLAQANHAAAVELAQCARVIKGYGDTHARGRGSFEKILALSSVAAAPAAGLAARIRQAREAALADEGGKALGEVLSAGATPGAAAVRTQTISFMPRKARQPPDTVESAGG